MVKLSLPVSHGIVVEGFNLAKGQPQHRPALLQVNDDAFPTKFLADLSTVTLPDDGSVAIPDAPVTLFQPVQRLLSIALLQLTCDSIGYPRLDPTRVDSAGLVIRRVVRTNGVDQYDAPPAAWMKSQSGDCKWTARTEEENLEDPDPTRRTQPPSGQPALDLMLAAQAQKHAYSETFTPAFVAAPAVCNTAQTTFVYGVIPTASSDIGSVTPAPPVYDPEALKKLLPHLLKRGHHHPILPGTSVNYQWISDDYAKAQTGGSAFLPFSATLRLLSSVCGAFDGSPQGQALVNELNNHFVSSTSYSPNPMPMGDFYQTAAANLITYDPITDGAATPVVMPDSWDHFTKDDADKIMGLIMPLLQAKSAQVTTFLGRFQDPTRFYRARVFLRIKGHAPGCPTQLVWSRYTDSFLIAPWHESGGRQTAPIPLPDPTSAAFRATLKPNCHFAVPGGLMNMMNASNLKDLTAGTGPSPSASGGISLNWICGFNIPLITICAFFVLNIFLILLNLVFFWLPFIKICIPFPIPTPATSGDQDAP